MVSLAYSNNLWDRTDIGFHFIDEEAEVSKIKWVGLNDETELGLDPMSPYSQSSTLFMILNLLSLPYYFRNPVMNPILQMTYLWFRENSYKRSQNSMKLLLIF